MNFLPRTSKCLHNGAPYELLNMYLYHASELLSKIHYMTGMSQIPAEGQNHYTVVYGLNLHKLKDKVEGHWGTCWRTM